MASPAGSGMFVVTQYIPTIFSSTMQRGMPVCQTPPFLKRFIQGEPKALGALQILIGLIQIWLGAILCIFKLPYGSIIIYSGVTFWTAVFFIISGAMSIAAVGSGTRRMVNASLGMNVVSTIAAGIEMAIVPIELEIDSSNYCPTANKYCDGIWLGIVSLLLIFSLLEFCIAFSTAVFGCKSVCCCYDNSEEAQPILSVQNNYTPDLGGPLAHTPGMPVAFGIQGAPGVPMQHGIEVARGVTAAPGLTSVPPPSYYNKLSGDAIQC